MVARGIRERIAIAFLAAAIVLGGVLGVMTVRSFTTQTASSIVAAQGDVTGQQPAATGAANTSSGAGGGSASTSSGGGSNAAGGGKIVIAVTR